MTWGIVPTQGGPAWRKCFKKTIPPQTWEIYPLTQAISHDKCIFGLHDLGQFVTDNRSLVWTLALGYHMSWRGNADFANHAESREWYAWICRIQKSIGSRYTGQPLTSFVHDRSPMLERNIDHREYSDDGIIKVAFAGRSPIRVPVSDGCLELTLPEKERQQKFVEPPADEKLRAPCNLPVRIPGMPRLWHAVATKM